MKRCLDEIGRSTGNFLFKILSYMLLGRTPARATAGGVFQFPDQTLLRTQSTRVSTDLLALGPSAHILSFCSWLVVRSKRIGDSSEKKRFTRLEKVIQADRQLILETFIHFSTDSPIAIHSTAINQSPKWYRADCTRISRTLARKLVQLYITCRFSQRLFQVVKLSLLWYLPYPNSLHNSS